MVHSQIYRSTRESDNSAEKSIHKYRIDCNDRVWGNKQNPDW